MGGEVRGVGEVRRPCRALLLLEGFELFAEGSGHPPFPIKHVNVRHFRMGHWVQSGFQGGSQGVWGAGRYRGQVSGADALSQASGHVQETLGRWSSQDGVMDQAEREGLVISDTRAAACGTGWMEVPFARVGRPPEGEQVWGNG